MKKYKFLFLLLFGLFFLIPKDTFAVNSCYVQDNNWNTIVSSSGEGCKSLAVPYNSQIYHIIYRIESPRLRTQNEYSLDMNWFISISPGSFQNVTGQYIQTYNQQNFYNVTSNGTIESLGNFEIYRINSVADFTSLSDENAYAVVFNYPGLTHVNYIGFDDVLVTLEGDNGTENAVVNGVTDIINNNNFNTQQIINAQNETNNILNDDNTIDASTDMSDFYESFKLHYNDNGLTNFVTAPLRLLNAFTTNACQPLSFPLPFVNDTVTLPCVKAIISSRFPAFYTLWQMLLTGVICYRVSINIFSKIHQLTNPFNDRIEVLQL